jgi:acetyl-CoA carboxylase alpha subunit
VEGFSEVN